VRELNNIHENTVRRDWHINVFIEAKEKIVWGVHYPPLRQGPPLIAHERSYALNEIWQKQLFRS